MHAGARPRIETRWSTAEDAEALADLHRAAWRNAYLGILPGPVIERMTSRRGPRWWRRLALVGAPARVIALDDLIAGYATLGRDRRRRGGGEIYELYLRPECQGTGLGAKLFEDTRRQLQSAGMPRLIVWTLSDNVAGCRFYRALGGREAGRSRETFDGARVEKTAFAWG
jgi:GNAT superfamily N-acetyltransferase